MSAIGYVNGRFCELAEAKISILDRGLLFGDAVYEALRVQNGRLFRARDHYERMAHGLDTLGIPAPFTAAQYEEILGELARRNGVTSGVVYVQVTRGAAMRSHLPPDGLPPNVFAFIQESVIPSWKKFPGGVAVATAEELRWSRCDLKTTMLLGNVIAKRRALAEEAFEAIFVSKEGVVREGAVSNIFAVIGGTLRTHPADPGILAGVTRGVVLQLARKAQVPVLEEAFSCAALQAAEEAFLTGTTSDVCPVVRVDGKPIGQGAIGPITARMGKLLAQTLEEETSRRR